MGEPLSRMLNRQVNNMNGLNACIILCLLTLSRLNAAFVSGGTAGEYRVKLVHNAPKKITLELNSNHFRVLLIKRFPFTAESLRDSTIKFEEAERAFEVTGDFPHLDSREAHEVLWLMIDYVALRRRGKARVLAEQLAFSKRMDSNKAVLRASGGSVPDG